VRQNLFPSFLNDKSAEKERIRSRETSASKVSNILTPSKIITDLINRSGSKSKTQLRKEEPLPEPEPMEEFWKVMNKNQSKNEVKQSNKENFMKTLFDQRQKTLKGYF
jgi:hypothetical protein